MKTAKDYSGAKTLCFKPEIKLCPNCNKPLKRSHIAWRKYIITLNSIYHVTSTAYKCSNTDCPQPQAIYRSQEAEMLSIKHYQFGLDVIAKVGHLRFKEHQTIRNIKQTLKSRFKLHISRSEVDLLHQAYLALTTATRHQIPPENQSQQRNHPCHRRRPTRKGQRNPLDPQRHPNRPNTPGKEFGVSRPKQHRTASKRNQNTKHPSEGRDKRWTKKHPTRHRCGVPKCSSSAMSLPFPTQHRQTHLRDGSRIKSGPEKKSK